MTTDPLPTATPTRKRFPMGNYWIVLCGIVLIAFLPLISFALAVVLVPLFGCDRGIVSYTCAVGGEGMGSLLGNMELIGWLFIITGPVGQALFCLWFVVLAVHALIAWSNSKQTPS